MARLSSWWPGRGPAALALAGGGVLALAFPAFDLWPLALVGLLPLYWLAYRLTPRRALVGGWLFGLGLGLVQLHWLTVVMTEFGGLPWPLAGLVLAALAGILAMYPALVAGLMALARGWGLNPWWLAPLLWAGLEWVRGWLFTGFPWLPLASALVAVPPLLQSAEIWGATGLSALVALVNALLARFLFPALLPGLAPGRVRRGAALGAAVILVAGGWWAGAERMATVRAAMDQAPRLTVSVVQAGVPQDQLWLPAMRGEVIRRYVELTRQEAAQANPRPWLAVWPESAAPFYFLVQARESQPVLELARDLGVNIALGSNGLIDPGPPLQASNRVWLVGSDGRPAGHYDKVHLVPFGEYVPLPQVFFFVRAVAALGLDFRAGQVGDTLEVAGRKVGPLICYESIFAELARAQARRGAQLFINQTNDAWYGRTGASHQQMSHLALRAVENRRAAARAATTGVSGFVLPDGVITGRTGLFRPEARTSRLPLLALSTPFTASGDLAGPLGLALGLLGVAAARLRRPKTEE
ncbi:MAG: apolipoprotein N-acyltransferase [Desulfarculus sp.]|nr:apolipoprotein N-acyltransferase [Desulfarculus sp.]